MSRIAFFAPLKPPTHANPSGDRSLARALIAALAANPAGWAVDLASALRLREGAGDADAQARLQTAAADEVARLAADPRDWSVWVTYHNYYKAPDLIGPAVARARGIPYLLIEASRARKRLTGPWAGFAAAAEAACDAAAAILSFTERDAAALARDRPERQRLIRIAPFLDTDTLPDPVVRALGGREILAVGMMRPGDKLASYRALAAALGRLPRPWSLRVVGDGAARCEVMTALAGLEAVFAGRLAGPALARAYDGADLLAWPGVNEAFGMVYLEAQAHGLPVVAEDRPGLREVVHAGGVLTPPGDPAAFAAAVRALLDDPARRVALGTAGRAAVAAEHLRPAATRSLWQAIRGVL